MEVVERVDQHIKAWFGKLLNRTQDQQVEFALQESVPILAYPAIGAYLPSPKTAIKIVKKPEPVTLPSTVNHQIQEELDVLNDIYPVPVTRFFEKDQQFGPNFLANLPKPYGTVSKVKRRSSDKPELQAQQPEKVLTTLQEEHVMETQSNPTPKNKPNPEKPSAPERETILMFHESNRIFSKSINQLVQGYFE